MLSFFSIWILTVLWTILLISIYNYNPSKRIKNLKGYKLDRFLFNYGIHRVPKESDSTLIERALGLFNGTDDELVENWENKIDDELYGNLS
jgi:hypothetical protein